MDVIIGVEVGVKFGILEGRAVEIAEGLTVVITFGITDKPLQSDQPSTSLLEIP